MEPVPRATPPEERRLGWFCRGSSPGKSAFWGTEEKVVWVHRAGMIADLTPDQT